MIIQNAVKITENHPEEFFLVSAHRHDYNTYTFKNGNTISVDGGNEYIRRGGCNPIPSKHSKANEQFLNGYATDWIEWCIDSGEPFDVIKSKLLWGTRGKDGKSPLKYVLLCKCETEHLEAILKTQVLSPAYAKVIKSLIRERRFPLSKIVKNFTYGKLGTLPKSS